MAENKANRPQAEGEQDLREILRIRRNKLKELQESGSDPFQITKYEADNDSANIKANFDALEGQPVSIAGRMMSKRGMGKVSFCDLQDRTGRIQLYARKDEMDEEEYNRFKKFDIGDILGVKGVVFRTQRGEMSVRVEKVTLLSKSLLPLPEKYHGLKDTDARYRQRYVDLIMNPEVKQTFVLRSRFIKFVRDFLDARGYMEVETPVLNTISGGATARPLHHPPQHLGHRHVYAHRHRAALKAADRGRGWTGCTSWAASSATRAWTPSTTRNSPRWSSTRLTPISTI